MMSSSFLSSSRTNERGESPSSSSGGGRNNSISNSSSSLLKTGGGVRSFLNSIDKDPGRSINNSYSTTHHLPYRTNNNNNNSYEDGALDADIILPPPSLHYSEEEEDTNNISNNNNKDFCFFDSLTQKWVNFEDFTEVPPCLEDAEEDPPASLRMWDESLSKIEEVTECSSGGRGEKPGFKQQQQRLVLPLNSVNTSPNRPNARPILVSTPSSSVSSSPFDKPSSSPPSLRRQISSSSNEPHTLIYPRQHRTLPSSRRSSVDESVESFPINYSRSSYNNNLVGPSKSPFGSGKIGGPAPSSSRPARASGSYNNSPALERRRKKSLLPSATTTTTSSNLLSAAAAANSSNRQNRSQSISNFNRLASSNLNKSKSYSSGNISLKSDYSHVQSKVKAYIKSIKDLPKKPDEFSSLSAGKKSLSMSNLASTSRLFPSTTSGMNNPHNYSSSNMAASNLKTFLSYANLDDLTITINRPADAKSVENLLLNSKSKFDTSRISRLLDNISDEEAMEDVIDSGGEEGKGMDIDLGGILTLAYNEMKDKQEAKKVLSQLQTNYDRLQRKYAEAENTIDKLRFGGVNTTSSPATSTPLPKDFLLSKTSLHNSSLFLGSSSTPLKGGPSSSSGSSLKQTLNDTLRSSPVLSNASSIPGSNKKSEPPDPREKRESNETTKKDLMDIQDQLYGLEILSDSLDPKERESAMEDVRRSFHSILVNFDNQRGRSRTDASDSEIVDLLKGIGKKLYVKGVGPKELLQKEEDTTTTAEEELLLVDTFEKVSNWKTNNPYAKAPSKIADILSRQQHQQVNDFDSGCCVASERSVRSKDSRPKQLENRLLPYNNFFKKKSHHHTSSSLIESSSTTTSLQEEDDEDESSAASKRQIKRVDTDLSSSGGEEEEPKAIVQQINEDINELRTMFEDHREEMMWLVAQEKQKDEALGRHLPAEDVVRPPSSRRSLSSLHFAAVSSSPPMSPGGSRRLPPGALKSPLHSRYLSQSQTLRRLGHIGQVRRKFDSEDTGEDLSMDDREIRRREFERRRKSRLTKRRSRESLVQSGGGDDEDEEECEGLELSGERRIFIPKLKLEDLWTDRTGDEEGGAFSSSSASSRDLKGKKKPNREIKDLLRSLEHANKMATKLKERSEEMLTVLKSEIAHPNASSSGYTEEVL